MMMQDDKTAIFQMRFPQKLWYLLNMRTDAILWGGTGRTILLNYRVLHSYLQSKNSIFKTTNISSFVRQLNLYGFRKVTSHLQDPLCNSSNPYMHEYVHDYFKYGRPEWLDKITRKALAMRKNFKARNVHGNIGNPEQQFYITPLQKARRTLQSALRKAAQNLFIQNTPKEFCNLRLECEVADPEDFCEDDDNVELDWLLSKNEVQLPQENPPPPPTVNPMVPNIVNEEGSNNFGETVETLMNFNDEPQPANDSFPGQFLNMPELDAEHVQEETGVELLAEFNIESVADQGITTTKMEKNYNSLNCVLPSIDNDQIDYNNHDVADQYNDGEWDQMFNDIIASKGPQQECSSELKELYSHISRTIDLLNP